MQFKELNLPFSVTRVWICGPPAMNQKFDQFFEEFAIDLGLEPWEIEIM